MGLFDKIKKAAPTVGATTAAGAAAAAGIYAGKAFSKEDSGAEAQNPNSESKTATPSVNSAVTPSTSEPENRTSQSAEQTSTHNSETGVTTYQYSNGNSLTEYADGSRAFYNAETGETTAYNAQTEETTIYEADGDVVVDSPDGSQVTFQVDGEIVGQASDGTTVKVTYDPTTGHTTVENYDGVNTGVFNSNGELISTTYAASTNLDSEQTAGGLFDRIMAANAEIPTELRASGLGIPDQPVKEFRTYQEGSLEDGHVRHGFVARAGWESTHSSSHAGQDEIFSGVELKSQAAFDAQSFVGAASTGEVEAAWNSEQAHLHAQGRVMVGAEANVDAAYKGTLDVEGVNYQPGVEAQGNANAFAGAEAEGKGDLNISSEGARGNLGGEAFAGAKAEAGGEGGLSIDGNEFARGGGGVNARAGIGVEANVDAGYQDGQITYGMNFGAALGVGAGYHYQGSIDAPGIITHPDAVIASVLPEETTSFIEQAADLQGNPSGYVGQFVVEQVQAHVPLPQEVNQFAEVVSNPGDALEDFGDSLGVGFDI